MGTLHSRKEVKWAGAERDRSNYSPKSIRCAQYNLGRSHYGDLRRMRPARRSTLQWR